jgi:hypothetical protein
MEFSWGTMDIKDQSIAALKPVSRPDGEGALTPGRRSGTILSKERVMNKKMMGFLLLSAIVILTTAWSQQAQTKIPSKIPTKYQPGSVTTMFPHIDSITIHCDGGPCAEYDISGRNLGATQGAKRVLINGTAATSYPHWTADSITITGPPMFWDVTMVFVIDNGVKPISNTFESHFLARWDGVSPLQAHAGEAITIHAVGAGATQLGHTLKMGAAPMIVKSWSGSNYAETIIALVPALPPGNYEIALFNGVNKISTPLAFKVI